MVVERKQVMCVLKLRAVMPLKEQARLHTNHPQAATICNYQDSSIGTVAASTVQRPQEENHYFAMPGSSESLFFTQYHSYLEMESSFVTMAWRDSVCFTWEEFSRFFLVFGVELRRDLVLLTHRLPRLEAFLFDSFFQHCREIENTQFVLNLGLLDMRVLLKELLSKRSLLR